MENFLKFVTEYEEVEACIPLFNRIDLTPREVIDGSFPVESRDYMMDKYTLEGTSVRFFSRLSHENQYLICCYLGYEGRYFEIYRTHNFLKTIACQYTPHISDEIFGYHNPDFDSYYVLNFYKSLITRDRKKLVSFSNGINSKI